MISIQLIIFLLFIHFLADFGLQTDDQAVNKSSSGKYLSMHVGVYSLCWLIAMGIWTGSFITAIYFANITFVFHFLTDYFTSRISKSFFDKKDFHNGFVIVGFDQLLHYIQLIFTYQYVITYFK